MTQKSKDVLTWGSEILKWLATALLAVCTWMAINALGAIEKAHTDINDIKLSIRSMEFNASKITNHDSDIDKLEARVRDLERRR